MPKRRRVILWVIRDYFASPSRRLLRRAVWDDWRLRNRLSSEVTGGKLFGLVLDQRRHLLAADGELGDRAAGGKDAAARWIGRRGDVALEQDAFLLYRGIGNRSR